MRDLAKGNKSTYDPRETAWGWLAHLTGAGEFGDHYSLPAAKKWLADARAKRTMSDAKVALELLNKYKDTGYKATGQAFLDFSAAKQKYLDPTYIDKVTYRYEDQLFKTLNAYDKIKKKSIKAGLTGLGVLGTGGAAYGGYKAVTNDKKASKQTDTAADVAIGGGITGAGTALGAWIGGNQAGTKAYHKAFQRLRPHTEHTYKLRHNGVWPSGISSVLRGNKVQTYYSDVIQKVKPKGRLIGGAISLPIALLVGLGAVKLKRVIQDKD